MVDAAVALFNCGRKRTDAGPETCVLFDEGARREQNITSERGKERQSLAPGRSGQSG